MKTRLPLSLKMLLVVLICLLVLFTLAIGLRGGDPRLKVANDNYQLGEKAKTIDQRQLAFNRALDAYVGLEQDYQPIYGNGRLYYDIGNTYFQLGKYGWTILYYQRAKALMPREEMVQHNLALVQEKLALPHEGGPGIGGRVFFFHTFLSLPERLQLFSVLCLFSLFFASACIWSNQLWYFRGCVVSLVLTCIMLLSLGYTRYLAPIEATLVQSTELRRDAGEQFAKVGKLPLPAGTSLEVLSILPDGSWFKVLSPSGDLGYVPQEAIRLN